jgi:hypothetical protein
MNGHRMNTATKVLDLAWENDAALYRLDPPLVAHGELISHVIVSSVPPLDGRDHGTLIFAATPTGAVTGWADLARNDVHSHADALAGIGYEVRL